MKWKEVQHEIGRNVYHKMEKKVMNKMEGKVINKVEWEGRTKMKGWERIGRKWQTKWERKLGEVTNGMERDDKQNGREVTNKIEKEVTNEMERKVINKIDKWNGRVSDELNRRLKRKEK